jgi:hypothetical protein
MKLPSIAWSARWGGHKQISMSSARCRLGLRERGIGGSRRAGEQARRAMLIRLKARGAKASHEPTRIRSPSAGGRRRRTAQRAAA